MILEDIKKLLTYAIEKSLIQQTDKIYITNQLISLFNIEEYIEPAKEFKDINLEEVLSSLTDYAYQNKIIPENSITHRDLFDTKIMGILIPRPSEIQKKFWNDYKISPQKATDFYYKISHDSDYIRTYRIKKDVKWVTHTEYGDIDITINLSKPEKDPKEIAMAKSAKQSSYPKCMLCIENEGYAGRLNHPARQNHRVIPIKIEGEDWGFQYSPYVYYNEHCIIFNSKHTPMQIDKAVFKKLFGFVKQFPQYFVGSNADLPIVGGSILTHEHFQGGNYDFAMAKASIETPIIFKDFEDIEAGIVKWAMSVIRLRGTDENRLVELGGKILDSWRRYSDKNCFIFSATNDVPHNTITPIARKNGEKFELDLVLRNNITTELYPLGVYHPHAELHHIKKENIGLIEVMGLAVLPARLKSELETLSQYIIAGKDIRSNADIKKHADWAESFIISKYHNINSENIDSIIKDEVGKIFSQVLECAGVYKRDKAGKAGFIRFIDTVNREN